MIEKIGYVNLTKEKTTKINYEMRKNIEGTKLIFIFYIPGMHSNGGNDENIKTKIKINKVKSSFSIIFSFEWKNYPNFEEKYPKLIYSNYKPIKKNYFSTESIYLNIKDYQIKFKSEHIKKKIEHGIVSYEFELN